MTLTPLEAWISSRSGAPGPPLERAALEAYQLERLNATLALARGKAPFYRRTLAGSPERLGSLEEIAALPFTTAEDLRGCGAEMVCTSQAEIERIVTLDTSGTTGEPKRLYFTRPDQELTIDFFQHGMSTFTRPGDRVMILLPYERPGSVGDLLAEGLRRLGAEPVPYGPVRDPAHALAQMRRCGAGVLVGAPAHLLALARFDARAGPPGPGPDRVLLSTDHVPGAVVSALESAWGCAVYNHYGLTESGLGGGVDCQVRRGYHLREADLLFEIVDPHSGRPLPEGEWGEIMFTTLTRTGMSLIRYRTGDRGRFLPGPCPCGTRLKTLEHVRSRFSGMVQLGPAGSISMADLDEALFPLPAVLNFSAALGREAGREVLRLEFTLLPGAGGGWRAQAQAALEGIPALGTALRAGRLALQVEGRAYDPAKAGSLAKRQIVDLRGGG